MSTCPAEQFHGNPFRYCPYCEWREPPADHDTAPGQAALSEEERNLLVVTFWGQNITPDASKLADIIAPTVERILADRLARTTAPGVEASDALRAAADDLYGDEKAASPYAHLGSTARWLRARADSLDPRIDRGRAVGGGSC